MINVLFSQARGVAIFNDGDQLRAVSSRNPTKILILNEQSAARLMAGVSDLEAILVYDRDALRKHLAIRSEREDLLNAALILLDGTRPKNLRQKAASFVSSRPNSDQWNWVENVLLSIPAPESADALGAAELTHVLGKFFRELSRSQQRVSVVRSAWHTLPKSVFGNDSREQANARVVGKGVFRALVTGNVGSRRSPFSPAIEAYARHLAGSESEERKHHWLATSLPAHLKVAGDGIANTWDIAPWRSAWLAAEWAETEAKLACDVTAEWQSTVTSIGKKNRAHFSKYQEQLAMIFEGWDCVRHKSSVSSTVDFIHQLVRHPQRGASRQILMEKFSAKLEPQYPTSNPVLPKHLKSWLNEAENIGESELINVVRTFFDAEKFETSETIQESLFSIKKSFDSELNLERRRSVAYCVHFDADSTLPVQCRHDEFINQKINNNTHHGANFAIWESVIKLALSTFCLDLRFQRGGFVVLVQELARVGNGSPQNKRAILMNFNNRNSHLLSGKIATIIQRLQRRLIADLSSGLPVERCGWLPIRDLANRIGVSNQSFIRRITDFERELIASGFDSNSLQVEANNLRLNPDMVATSSMMGPNAKKILSDSTPKSDRAKSK